MNSDLYRRYQGCIATPALWTGAAVLPYPQLELPLHAELPTELPVPASRRLGKQVETFLFHHLRAQPGTLWVEDGLQIGQGKRTVGELDALYYEGSVSVHLEIAYKFYLYDPHLSTPDDLARWQGPNRKDNLALKLQKLRTKQFPLLHSPLTRPYLDGLGLRAETIEQRLCLKAQLFLPLENQQVSIEPLNRDCVAGFYLSLADLEQFEDHQFHLPAKPDWLMMPHPDVDWLDHTTACARIQGELAQQRSPMVWLRGRAGELKKGFLVFW